MVSEIAYYFLKKYQIFSRKFLSEFLDQKLRSFIVRMI